MIVGADYLAARKTGSEKAEGTREQSVGNQLPSAVGFALSLAVRKARARLRACVQAPEFKVGCFGKTVPAWGHDARGVPSRVTRGEKLSVLSVLKGGKAKQSYSCCGGMEFAGTGSLQVLHIQT